MAKRNFSSKRNAVYEAIKATDTHPCARWVYEQLKPDFPELSLGTVYRNIALFKDEGKVNVICTVNGEERIDATVEPHPHFVCESCGGVYDVCDNGKTTDDFSRLARDGFIAESKYILYRGLCPKCSAE